MLNSERNSWVVRTVFWKLTACWVSCRRNSELSFVFSWCSPNCGDKRKSENMFLENKFVLTVVRGSVLTPAQSCSIEAVFCMDSPPKFDNTYPIFHLFKSPLAFTKNSFTLNLNTTFSSYIYMHLCNKLTGNENIGDLTHQTKNKAMDVMDIH